MNNADLGNLLGTHQVLHVAFHGHLVAFVVLDLVLAVKDESFVSLISRIKCNVSLISVTVLLFSKSVAFVIKGVRGPFYGEKTVSLVSPKKCLLQGKNSIKQLIVKCAIMAILKQTALTEVLLVWRG